MVKWEKYATDLNTGKSGRGLNDVVDNMVGDENADLLLGSRTHLGTQVRARLTG